MGTVLPLSPREDIEAATSAHNEVVVRRVRDRVDLDVAGATFATFHPRFFLTGYSWDALSFGCLIRSDGPPASVLILGLGGGTVARQLRCFMPNVRLVGVEIDASIVDIARRHMRLDEAKVEVIVDDAYAVLARSPARYDAIIDDLFLTGPTDVTRTRVPQGETLALLRSRLSPRGVLVANFITEAGAHRQAERMGRRAFLDAFDEVRAVTPPRGLNEILVGGSALLPKSGAAAFRARLSEAHDQKQFDDIRVRRVAKAQGGDRA